MTYSDVVLADSPAIYWRLGESSGTTAVDSSGNGRDGTYTGSPTLGVSGLIRSDSDTAMSTSGTTAQYASVADTANLTAVSVEAWVTGTSTNSVRIIGARNDGTNEIFRLYLIGTQPYFTVNITGTQASGTGAYLSFTLGTVHHLVGTYDGTTVRLYIDGVEAASEPVTGALYTGDIPFSVGARSDGGWPYAGTLDEVVYYTTALSSARVAAHYAAGVGIMNVSDSASATQTSTVVRSTTVAQTLSAADAGTVETIAGEAKNVYELVTASDTASAPAVTLSPNQTATAVDAGAAVDAASTYAAAVIADSPALYWRLGEASGTTAADSSGHGRAGTISGGPTMGTTGLLTGDASTAITFDGTNDKIAYASSVLSSSSQMSFECWVNLAAAPSSSKYLVDGTNLLMYVDTSGVLHASVTLFSTNNITGPVITDGLPHHIVVTVQALTSKADVWVDGIQYVTTGLLNSGTISIPQLTVGGHSTLGFYLAAVVDEVALYGTRLSKDRIRTHYALGSGTPLMVDADDTATAATVATRLPVISYTPDKLGAKPPTLDALDGGSNSASLIWGTPGIVNFENGVPTGITHGGGAYGSIVDDADATTGTTKALQPGDLDDDTVTWSEFVLDLDISTPLTFRYHSVSEEDYDYGSIVVDGITVVSSTGIFGWQSATSDTLATGHHVIYIEYSKDSSYSEGFDNIRVGQISVPVTVTDYEYRVDGGTPVALGSTTTSTSITGLSAGSHTFEVRSITTSGTSDWSDPATAVITTDTLTIDASVSFSGTGTLTATGAIGTVSVSAAETTVTMPAGAPGDAEPAVDVVDFDNYPEGGYRYFTFDIMSDQLLAEIPLNDVTFSIKLGAPGELSGTLPVGQLDYDIDPYTATMPMRTALYVLRDKKPVWGGIIWARDYDANNQTLQLSCATWESYLFRRYMWHTYTSRDDIDQWDVVKQILWKMRTDFAFDYDAYDWVIPAPQSSTVDIMVGEGTGAGRTQDAMTFKRDDMKSFGEVLTEYANNLNGFEWYFRIDFNEKALRFRRKLVLLHTPPALLPKGSDDPPYDEAHRPGINTYLFEYPGNIASITLTEDGDNACTRQFVVGGYSTSISASAPKPIGSWNNEEYLEAGYPLIENVESSNHSTTSRMPRLLKLATIYGRDSAPPMRSWNIIVNGSMDPIVSTYRVGHWCRLVVNDPFLKRSLETSYDFDPLGGVVKRIVGYEVAVPNDPQTAELVTLELEDDPTVSFDLTHEEEQGSLLDDRGPFIYGTYMPDASTTGVVDTDALTNYNAPSDDSVILAPGTVIKDQIIYGDIFIDPTATGGGGGAIVEGDGRDGSPATVKPVILRRCRLVGGDNIPTSTQGVVNVNAPSGQVALQMFDCEIKPRHKTTRRDGVIGRGFEAYRVYVENVTQGFVLDPGSEADANLAVKVLGCWVGRLLRVDGRSSRGLWHKGGSNVLVKGNRFAGFAWVNSDYSGEYSGSTSAYIIVNNYADEVIYISDPSGVAGYDVTVVYQQNFILRGAVQTRIKASIDDMVYEQNYHFWDVAVDAGSGYPGTWIWIDSRSSNIVGIDTNIWKDGPYVGSNLMEPRAMGLYYEGA